MFEIRKATDEDCSSIMSVHARSVLAIPVGHYSAEEIASWAIPRRIEDYQESVANKAFYVAVSYQRIVGFGVFNSESHEIEALYVAPEANGKGIGRSLLKELEERAHDLGIEIVRLNASLNAVAFYSRAGFIAQEESKYRLASGLEIRCVPMIKKLI
jgi:ribosomal protein S18 acetylase RimI-like enzyme